MVDHALRFALSTKDKKTCYRIILSNLNGTQLIDSIHEMLYASASVVYSKKYDNKLILHPICVINSIKNFIGDEKENPSKNLMKFAIDYLYDFEYRINDVENLDRVLKNGIGQTVFVGEFEDACQNSDWQKAEIMMSKIFLASDRSRSILDTLAGLALQNGPKNVLFVYHLLRSYQFKENKDDSWTFIKCIFEHIKRSGINNAHGSVEIMPNNIKQRVIQSGDIIIFSAIDNIWNGDYVRKREYRRELSYWLNKIRYDGSVVTNLINDHFLIDNNKKSYVRHAEKIINEERTQNEKAKKLVILEAIRSMCKNIDSQGLRYLGSRFNHIILS